MDDPIKAAIEKVRKDIATLNADLAAKQSLLAAMLAAYPDPRGSVAAPREVFSVKPVMTVNEAIVGVLKNASEPIGTREVAKRIGHTYSYHTVRGALSLGAKDGRWCGDGGKPARWAIKPLAEGGVE